MRTVTASLTSELAKAHYQAYAKVICLVDTDTYETHDALYYELTGVECIVRYRMMTYESCISFVVERGCVIAGSEVGLTTSNFYPHRVENLNGIITVYGHLFEKNMLVSIDGDDTYENIITAFCTAMSKTAVLKNPTDVYWQYRYLTTGRFAAFNHPSYFLNQLRQKYLMFAVDNGGEEILFYYPALSLSSGSVDWSVEPDFLTYDSIRKKRNFLWRDEDSVIHYAYTSGTFSTYPVHNLGYINSADKIPCSVFATSTYVRQDLQYFEFVTRPDLRYQDGDSIYISSHSVLSRLLVKEIWKKSAYPRWQMIISSVQYFASTEGGSLPESMEGLAAYTPLNTGYFTNVLSTSDNNVQAAFETLDDHDHVTFVTSAPSAAVPGSVFAYDTAANKFYIYDGSGWHQV